MAGKQAKKEATFEKDLEELERIVHALEDGGLSLDESLKQFEKAMLLARRCDKALTEAEKRIEILLKNAEGDLEAQPFDPEQPMGGGVEQRVSSSSGAEAEESEEAGEAEGDLLF
jgi:exodeoxyribonuclease VII small subunit